MERPKFRINIKLIKKEKEKFIESQIKMIKDKNLSYFQKRLKILEQLKTTIFYKENSSDNQIDKNKNAILYKDPDEQDFNNNQTYSYNGDLNSTYDNSK